jgi:acyl dehydratase
MQDKFKEGDFVEIRRSFTLEDVKIFSKLSGDYNPIHINEEFANKSIFQRPIVHGILVSSLFSSLIANELPGPGSIYLSQTLQFKAPVYHNVEIIARVEISKVRIDKPIYELKTICLDNEGKVLIEGVAIIKLLK